MGRCFVSENAARYEDRSPDANVERVRAKLLLRSQVGLKKYGCTTERADLDLLAWARHLQEELMDATVYVERIMNDLRQLGTIMEMAKRDCKFHLIDPVYDLPAIEQELELQALEIGDLEK